MIAHTISRIITCFTLLILIVFSTPLSRPKNDSPIAFDECISVIVKKSAELSPKKRIRLAVIQFSSTQDSSYYPFGNYLSENLISALSATGKFGLFERNRLDAITKELSLNQSGLIDEDVAKRIGELAPIDYIVTGSFTRMKSSVEISGRILDVVTGEIKLQFSQQVALTENLKVLFPSTVTSSTVTGSTTSTSTSHGPENSCVRYITEGKMHLKNDDARSLIKLAMKIPFSNTCAHLHRDIVDFLIKAKFNDKEYHHYLLSELQKTGDPDHTRGAVGAAIEYFLLDQTVTAEEWESIKSMLSFSKNQSFHLRIIFDYNAGRIPHQKLFSLMDDFIVKTTSAPPNKKTISDRVAAFYFLIPDIDEYDSSSTLFNYWFTTHQDKLKGNDLDMVIGKLIDSYTLSYIHKIDTTIFLSIMSKIVLLENHSTPGENNAKLMYKFINKFDDISFRIPDQWQSFFIRQRDELGNGCRNQLQKVFPFLPARYMEYITPFCLRYDITVPGKIPSIEELSSKLSSDKLQEQTKAAELLSGAGTNTLSVLPALTRALKRSIVNKGVYGNPNFQYALIKAIAASKTEDYSTHQLLISMLEQPSHTGVPDEAKKAIASMGKTVVPSIQKIFPEKNSATQLKMLEILKMMRKDASAAIPWLKKLQSSSADTVIKDAIEDTIESIR